jgi:hypothetical protein
MDRLCGASSLGAPLLFLRGGAAMKLSLLLICIMGLIPFTAQAGDPLPSWNESVAKTSIINFVTKTTTEGTADFVAPADRIAVFDNDGTLWAEQPAYFQLLFAIDRVKILAPKHPEWAEKEPFKSAIAGDLKSLAHSDKHGLIELVMAAHAGMTVDEFNQIVRDWIATAKHPTKNVAYTKLVYQPMLEVLSYLRANGLHRTFTASRRNRSSAAASKPGLKLAMASPCLCVFPRSTSSTIRKASQLAFRNSSAGVR